MQVIEAGASLLAGTVAFLVVTGVLLELLGGFLPFTIVFAAPVGLIAALGTAVFAYVYLASLVYRQPPSRTESSR